jgi:hypothetical protein
LPIFVLLAGWLLSAAAGLAQGLITDFERDQLTIETASGKSLVFQIEVARSEAEKSQGLMFRTDLADDAGMLFVYGAPQFVSMWMKNTLIPLDMVFIDGGGTITKIAQRTTPQSLRTVTSDRPVRGVLELSGGSAARLAIRPGDRVVYPAFDKAP